MKLRRDNKMDNTIDLTKLKPFNAEGAMKGEKVVTGKGEEVRVICIDRRAKYPVIGLVDSKEGERVASYTINGRMSYTQSSHDLFMAPTKKTIYINIFSTPEGFKSFIFDNEARAEESASVLGWQFIKTVIHEYYE